MNKALLSKVGWRLTHDHGSLWARVLRNKYKVGDIHNPEWLRKKGPLSSTWRSIRNSLCDVVIPGLSWVVGNGKDINFWMDRWLLKKPLIEMTMGELPAGYESIKIHELWRNGGGWDLPRITPYISDTLRLMLPSVVVDTVTGAKDRVSWSTSSDGRFTVKSAYDFLTLDDAPKQQMGVFFGAVWKVIATERVRLFLWLVVHQAIMTNMERQRRHLAESGICQVCRSGEETILHVLRDCGAMAGLWRRLVPLRKQHSFFTSTLLEWIYENLCDNTIIEDCPWATIFANAVWWGWKWRCDNVFGGNGKCRDRVRFIKELAKEVGTAHMAERGGNQRRREARLIAWAPPPVGWFKLNTDGASHGNPGFATAGGVVRDSDGSWCSGFVLNIGICSAPLAELWGVYYGLYIAWERGITRLELEVDSESVVGFLRTGIDDSHPLSFLVRLCYGFLSRDWIVRVSHVYREANRLADGLANYAFSLPLGFHLLSSTPDSINMLLSEDVNGVARPRDVCV